MNYAYTLNEILEKTDGLAERRRIIYDYLSSQDITAILPKGSSLSEEMRIPWVDGIVSPPIVVGNKYTLGGHICTAYAAHPLYMSLVLFGHKMIQ